MLKHSRTSAGFFGVNFGCTAIHKPTKSFYMDMYFHYTTNHQYNSNPKPGARYSSVVRAFTHGAMGRQIDSSWGGPIELFLVPASAPRLV